MNTVNENIISHANEAALLNVLMYLDIKDVYVEDTWSMKKIIKALGTIYDDSDGYEVYLDNRRKEGDEGKIGDYLDRQRQYQILANACETNEHFANLIIDNQSRLMKNPSYPEGGLNAATFTDTDGKVTVVYRGTGSGEWIDNGLAISGTMTESPQQEEAVEYFNRIVEKNGYDIKNTDIDISGHSKGGNKAQYVTINSKYRDLIGQCFNFDGQGMSPEAIDKFRSTYGEAYIEAVNKMYGFYAENDFVNPLGIPVVPQDHKIYFKPAIEMKGIEDNKKHHYADAYLTMDGAFSEETVQGQLSRLVEDFSLQASMLPPFLRVRVTNAFMGLMQGGEKTVNGESVSILDYAVGGATALPLLLTDLLLTPEGRAVTDDLGGDLLVTIKEKGGLVAELGAAAVLAAVSPRLFADDLARISVEDFKILAAIAMENLQKLGGLILEKLRECGTKFMELAEDIGKALNEFAKGAAAAWSKVQGYVAGLYNEIVNAATKAVAAVESFKNKAGAAVASFFNSLVGGVKSIMASIGKAAQNVWNSGVEKVRNILEGAKGEIKKQSEEFKEAAGYLYSHAKQALARYGENAAPALRNFSKKVMQGMAAYGQARLSVDLERLAELQDRLRRLEEHFGERISRILAEAEKISSGVGRSYSEYYVQQQVGEIRRTCEQVRQRGRKVCDELRRKASALQYAIEHYREIERLLDREIRDKKEASAGLQGTAACMA